MTTRDEVKKNLEKAYDQLTPGERAQWVINSSWEMADTLAPGEDIAEQEQSHHQFIKNYVHPLSAHDYIDYLHGLSDCIVAEWGRRYFSTYINGLVREDAWITLLLINLDSRWNEEIEMASKKRKDTLRWKKTRERLIVHIKICRDRKRKIMDEIDEIMASDLCLQSQ